MLQVLSWYAKESDSTINELYEKYDFNPLMMRALIAYLYSGVHKGRIHTFMDEEIRVTPELQDFFESFFDEWSERMRSLQETVIEKLGLLDMMYFRTKNEIKIILFFNEKKAIVFDNTALHFYTHLGETTELKETTEIIEQNGDITIPILYFRQGGE